MNRVAIIWLISLIIACVVLVGCETDSGKSDPSTTTTTSSTAGSGATTTTTDGESDESPSTSVDAGSTSFVTDELYWSTFTYPDGYFDTTDEQYWSTYQYPDGYWETYTDPEYWATYTIPDDYWATTDANFWSTYFTNPTGVTITNPNQGGTTTNGGGSSTSSSVYVPTITVTNNAGQTVVVTIPPQIIVPPITTSTTQGQNGYQPPQSTTTTTTTRYVPVVTGGDKVTSSSTTTTTTTTTRYVPVVTGGGKITTTTSKPIVGDELNVVEYGVDNTGRKDMTAKLTELHATGKRIYYPNGIYLFNGKTLNFSGGVRFESPNGVIIRNSISATPIVNFDSRGNLIGLMQNHLEYKATKMHAFDKTGSLVSPPISTANYDKKVELLPFWYNDFGLHTRLMTWNGGIGWYDWSWNHHDASGDGYDPTLHPLLGYYFGDDPVVLDWQCYWLREYGIDQAALTNGGISSDPKSGDYWVYQLLNNAPNAQNMDFALWVSASSYSQTYDDYKSNWWNTFEQFYFKDQYKDQVYCYEENGKRYPVIWLWDEESIRYSIDRNNQGTMPNTVKLYKEVAQAFKEEGFDGVCIMARSGCMPTYRLSTLSSGNVKWFKVAYPQNSAGSGSTYGECVSNFKTLSNTNELYGVATGMDSHTPHPSNWNCPGTTPGIFENWLKKAVIATTSGSKRAKIVTCYNMAEWAEGGPGLQPTVGNGFGYLEAVYNAIVK